MPRSFLIKKNRQADMAIKSVDNQADHYQEPTPSNRVYTEGTTAKWPRSGSNVKSTDIIYCRPSPCIEDEASPLTLDIKNAITFNHSKTELYDSNTQPFYALYKQQGNGIDFSTGSVSTWRNDARLREEQSMLPVAIKQENFGTDEEQGTSPTTEDSWNTHFSKEAGMPPCLIHHLSLAVQHGGREGRCSSQRLPSRTVEHKLKIAGFLELADGETFQENDHMAQSYNRAISPASLASEESAAGSNPRDDQGPSTSSVSQRKDKKSKATSTKKYRYTCDVCNKSFSRSNTLTTHKRIHTGDKPFICEQCGRAFRQPGNLTRHRLTHTTVKPYVCPQCNKAFNRASNLHTHMRTHTNYKPFTCDFCGKGFHQKIDMKIHRYTHTGEKPHKCDKCGRGFKQLTHLTYHLRTHSDLRMYRCEHCGKGFNQKGNLQAHIYGHTGERPFKCQTCGKGFTLASTLNTHKRTHALKKPFECQFCSKAFYQKNALKTHYIASHPYANGVSLL